VLIECICVLMVCRLVEDRGVINRYGFNSEGMHAAEARLKVLLTHTVLSHLKRRLALESDRQKVEIYRGRCTDPILERGTLPPCLNTNALPNQVPSASPYLPPRCVG
jgi:hypothetical protein